MNSESLPLVSVLSLCYNQSEFCEETLNSIYNQTYKNIEVILIDDYSSDNSVEVIQRWIENHPDLNIRFIAHDKNKGICKSLNEGLSYAKGKYVELIACDDLMMPEKTEKQVTLLERAEEDVALVYSDAYLIKADSSPRYGWFIQMYRQDFTSLPQGNIYQILLEGNFIPVMSTIIKTSVLRNLGGFDESLVYEDYDMLLQISRQYKILFSDYVSVKYRLHGNNNHRSHSAMSESFLCSNVMIFKKHLPHPLARKKLMWALENLYKRNPSLAKKQLEQLSRLSDFSTLLFRAIQLKLPYSIYRILNYIKKT